MTRTASRRLRWVRIGFPAALSLLLACSACGSTNGSNKASAAGDSTGSVHCGSPTQVRYAFGTAAGTPYDAGGKALEAYLNKNAPGCFTFNSFPNSQLGSEVDMERGVQSGSIQLAVGAFTLNSFAPASALTMTPFVMRDRQQMEQITNGPIGATLSDRISSQSAFKPLGFFTAGDRSVLSTKPISNVQGLKDLKIRVAASDVQVAVWKAVGTAPVALAFPEMYSALQNGTIDAVELDPVNIVTQKLDEVAKYYDLTHHLVGAYPLVTSKTFYNSLPKNLQKVFTAAGLAGAKAEQQADVAQADQAIATMKSDGVKFINFNTKPLKPLVTPVFAKYPNFLPPDLLTRIQKLK